MRRTTAVLARLLLLAGPGLTGCNCGDDGQCTIYPLAQTPPTPPPPDHQIRILSGDNQAGLDHQVLAQGIVGEITTLFGTCVFEIELGDGTLHATRGSELGDTPGKLIRMEQTPDDPRCAATWVLGDAGVNTVKLHFYWPPQCQVVSEAGHYQECHDERPGGNGGDYGFVRFTAQGYGPPANLVIREGDGQTGDTGQPLPARPRVGVTDAGGNPVPGINVVFVAQPGGGTPASPVSATTSRVGDATMPVDWVLGPAVGSQFLSAVAGEVGSPLALTGNPALFSASARVAPAPLVPARIDIVEGDNQNTIAGSPVPQPVRVRVTSASGEPVPGVLVDFVPDRGTVTSSPAATFADGIATPGTWRPGYNEAGTFHLTATAQGENIANNPVLFTATVSVGQGGTNTLQLYNGTNMNANIILDSEAPAPSNSLGPSGTRDVQIFTAINTSVAVLAYIGGSQVASARCTVTAAAWQGGTRPLVALFSDGRYLLTCSNF